MNDDEKTEISDAKSQGWLTTKRRISIAIGTLVIVAIALTILNQAVKSKTTETVADIVDPYDSIEISSPGKVTLMDGPFAISRTSKYVFKKPTASVKVDEGVLKIQGDCGGLRLGGCSVDYNVVVPSDVPVKVINGGGAVALDGVKADVAISTKTGTVMLEKSYGRVEVETDTGAVKGTAVSSLDVMVKTDSAQVDLRFAASPKNVDVESQAGAVHIAVPKTATNYQVDVSSQSGKTVTDIARDGNSPFSIKARSGSGDVTVEAK